MGVFRSDEERNAINAAHRAKLSAIAKATGAKNAAARSDSGNGAGWHRIERNHRAEADRIDRAAKSKGWW